MIEEALRAGLPAYSSEPDGYRLYMRAYMAFYRSGRRLRGRGPLRRRFNRPGHCDSCGHIWPFGNRCPMCAAEPRKLSSVTEVDRARLLRAWMELMEVVR